MPVPVDAFGRLTLVDARGRSIAVDARGAQVAVGFPDLTAAREAYAAFTRSGGGNRTVSTLQRELRRADIALEFQVRGIAVAQLRGNSRGSWIGRALQLGGTELRLFSVLRALLQR